MCLLVISLPLLLLLSTSFTVAVTPESEHSNNTSSSTGCDGCVLVCCSSDTCEQTVKQVEESLANADWHVLLTIVHRLPCTHGTRVGLNHSADYTLGKHGQVVVSPLNHTLQAGQYCFHNGNALTYCSTLARGETKLTALSDIMRTTPVYKCCPANHVMEEMESPAPTTLCVGRQCGRQRKIPIAPHYYCTPANNGTLTRWRPKLLYNHTLATLRPIPDQLHTAEAQLRCPLDWGVKLRAYVLRQRRRSRWFQLVGGQLVIPQIDTMFAAGLYCQDWLATAIDSQPLIAQVCMTPAFTVSDSEVQRRCTPHCYRKCCPPNTTLVVHTGPHLGDYCVPTYSLGEKDTARHVSDSVPLVVGLPQKMADPSIARYVIQVIQNPEQIAYRNYRCPVGTRCPLLAVRLANGDLYVPHLRTTYPAATCCLDTKYKTTDGGVTVTEMVTEAVCEEATANKLERIVKRTLHVSCACLVATLCGLATMYRELTLHDHCLAAHSASLLSVYIMTALSSYVTTRATCLLVGALNYLANMSAYAWLNIINYNIWRSISKAAASTAPPIGARRCGLACSSLLRYHCLGWGLPLAMTVVLVFIDVVWQHEHQHHPLPPNSWPPPPDLAYTYCHHPYGASARLYYYLPMMVLTLPTAFFFGSTVMNLVRHYRSTAKLSAHTGLVAQTRIYLKLLLAMELCWVVEAIIVFANVSDVFNWIVLINATCGVSTLVMFLAGHNNRKRLRLCLTRLEKRWRLINWRRSQHTTAGTPFTLHSYKHRTEEISDLSSSSDSSAASSGHQKHPSSAGDTKSHIAQTD